MTSIRWCPLCNEGITLLNVLFEIRQASLEQFFLLGGERAERIDLLDAIFLKGKCQRHSESNGRETYTELNAGREEVDTLRGKKVTLDKGRSDDALLSV